VTSKKLINKDVQEDESQELEMSFLDHLEELRWRLIYALIGVVVGTIISWIFINFLINFVLLKPAQNAGVSLQNLKPFGQIFLYFQVSVIAGIVISIPNIFYQFWKFIAPALKQNERRYILAIVFYSTFCFLAGIVFAYFSLLPYTMQFAEQFGTTQIKNVFAIDEYLSIIISVMLGAGIIFELPMISFFLTRLGIVTPKFMKKYRKYAVVIIFVIAAFLTPPDPVSQVVLAVPLVLLYEISIFISKFALKKK
jgi:sec-independent protein translocase protein TatC